MARREFAGSFVALKKPSEDFAEEDESVVRLM
jgi:hypothetical protein